MHSRALHRIFALLLASALTIPAFAQFPKDNSANLKIDEAINNHYLMMELDKAESLLTGVVKACEDKCSPQTKAKAWMYVGIVRGSGKNDQAGAKEAFVTAKGIDPAVQLDREIASPETQATFDAVPGGTGTPAPGPGPVAPPVEPAPTGEVPGDMVCTPEARDIQTRMPIPVSCSSQAQVASAELRFKEPGADKWKKTAMSKVGEFWQAEIPCDVTKNAGALLFYVAAKDAAGEYVDQYGSKKQPGNFNLGEAGEAPSFPGQAPVNRCADSSDCPPDFPGCESNTSSKSCGEKDWGASCDNSSECQCGLVCNGGQCDKAPSCKADADCGDGMKCGSAGTCESTGGESAGPAGPFAKHWLGLDVGFDLVSIGGSNLCTPDRITNYGSQCTDAAGNPTNVTGPGVAGAGFAPGQLRFKLGYDFAFHKNFAVGARVGVGFLNTRPSHLPVSAEARITYTITSLANAGIRPFIYVGGGLLETNGYLQSLGVNIYKFNDPPISITPGAGLGYAIAPNMAVKLDATVIITVGPAPGFALSPNLGFVYGL